VQLPHEWLLITDKNEIVNRLAADELIPVNENLFIIKASEKYGLIDNDLKLVCPVRYDVLSAIGDDLYLARQSRKMGIIKSDNTTVVPFMYDSLYAHENILRAFRKIEGWSLIDRHNVTLTKKNYDWIGPQNKNLYPVINNHYWGILSATGEEIVHCVFDSLVEVSNDLLVVKFKNQYGIINTREDWLVAPQTQPLHLINHQLYSQKQSPNIFLKNFGGEIVYFTDNQLDFKEDFFYEYLTDGTEKTIDYQGRIVNRMSPPAISNVEHIFPSSEGLRGIQRDGKFGFIDERGRLRIANRYDDIGEFHEGLAPFKLIGKWGFINPSDQVIINPNYEKVNHFNDGLCVVSRNGKSGVITKTGKPILTFQYDSIHALPNKKFLLFAEGLRGMADEKGSILIDPRFDYLSELENGLVLVGIAGKFGVLTATGLNVVPIIYENISFDKKHNQFLALKKSEWREVDIK
jgi:WG containing repeat